MDDNVQPSMVLIPKDGETPAAKKPACKLSSGANAAKPKRKEPSFRFDPKRVAAAMAVSSAGGNSD